ncbi:hypothetical protein IE81DRAFT_20964 [Ceraceosorus guamensis]|uniref:Uncharacterized protein n=1 Tax=Ceraceosorus guamensis TaxID=1522189 RepID=A0A316W3L1_9BASI|nr:hypothetical protein IE81DRAFT_20964 [Ceraceosorus guamensis]PWN44466.1 hypothetical protein IE81DRAFT_20964 [Ceraceosorus guamensis]
MTDSLYWYRLSDRRCTTVSYRRRESLCQVGRFGFERKGMPRPKSGLGRLLKEWEEPVARRSSHRAIDDCGWLPLKQRNEFCLARWPSERKGTRHCHHRQSRERYIQIKATLSVRGPQHHGWRRISRSDDLNQADLGCRAQEWRAMDCWTLNARHSIVHW